MSRRVKAITWLQVCLALWACLFPALAQARQASPRQVLHDQLDLQSGFPKCEVFCIFAVVSITTYVGSYEREEHYNSSSVLWQIRHRHMVGGFLQIKRTETSGQSGVTEVLSYFLKDHLGSTTAVLDENGTVVERPSFDAWGKTRHAATWADADASVQWLSSAHTNRGFTGHEQLDESGLVHMNGRIYDPEVGRFLSPDPYVQDPEHSQNFNRYAYVLNNPLSYTDPSGYFFTAVFAAVIKAVITAVTVAVQAIVTVGKWVYSAVKAFLGTGLGKFLFGAPSGVGNAILKGATWGGINGAASGARGSNLLRGILVGGITAGISTGLLHPLAEVSKVAHTVGHGVVGGAANVAMGGKFQDGFLSGAAGAVAGHLGVYRAFENTGPWGRTVVAGVVGGTVSAIGGGKFANGAYTAAFQHFFNNEANFKKLPPLGQLAAKMAKAAYEDDIGELATLGIDIQKWTGFHARLTKHEMGMYVLAFRGTHDLADWAANLRQGVGDSSIQYQQALELTGKVLRVVGKDNLLIAGHSLGGGLASHAALKYQVPAYTFNAAGLHFRNQGILGHRTLFKVNHIKAYYIRGEVLSSGQKWLGPLAPDAVGTRIPMNGSGGAVEKHGMEQFLP